MYLLNQVMIDGAAENTRPYWWKTQSWVDNNNGDIRKLLNSQHSFGYSAGEHIFPKAENETGDCLFHSTKRAKGMENKRQMAETAKIEQLACNNNTQLFHDAIKSESW